MKTIIEQNKEWLDNVWAKTDSKLRGVAIRSREKLPFVSVNGVHDDKKGTTSWVSGFLGGMMWLMYEATGNEVYRTTAERSEELLDMALRQVKLLHHDVGFMWHLTSGAHYRLTGNESACARNYLAAAMLFSRYNVEGEYIQAWNIGWKECPDCSGVTIMDTLMNLPLLYWASEEIGNDRFEKVGMRHMDMALRDHIRPDGTVNHIVEHELNKPIVKRVMAGQGYSETSCWSRGLAWAVYGSIISYIHTGKQDYLAAAIKTADRFIVEVKKTNYLPLVDFDAPATPVYYDSTAGVCAACGMLEIAKYVSDEEAKRYTLEAINILKACDEHWCNYEDDEDGLVTMGTVSYPLTEASKRMLHIPIIWGDFFFVEALCKLKGRDFLIW